jgi:hypothetical protein
MRLMRAAATIAALLVLALAFSQLRPTSAPAQATVTLPHFGMLPWPKHPADIVNLDLDLTGSSGQYVTVYQVPAGRWLLVHKVVTQAWHLFQNDAGVRTRKLYGGYGYLDGAYSPGSTLPSFLAFPPGSTVELLATGNPIQFHLNGHLLHAPWGTSPPRCGGVAPATTSVRLPPCSHDEWPVGTQPRCSSVPASASESPPSHKTARCVRPGSAAPSSSEPPSAGDSAPAPSAPG